VWTATVFVVQRCVRSSWMTLWWVLRELTRNRRRLILTGSQCVNWTFLSLTQPRSLTLWLLSCIVLSNYNNNNKVSSMACFASTVTVLVLALFWPCCFRQARMFVLHVWELELAQIVFWRIRVNMFFLTPTVTWLVCGWSQITPAQMTVTLALQFKNLLL